MDFALSEDVTELAALVRRVVAERSSASPHGEGGFDRDLWQELARAGVIDAALPSSVGGGGLGLLGQCAVLIELGRAVAEVPYLPTVVAASAIASSGDGRLVERWVVPAVRGQAVLAPALPDAGAPTGFTAETDGDGWRLSGSQTAVPFASFADALVVRGQIGEGTAVFVVDAEHAEIESQSVIDHADAGLVELSGVPGTRIPEASLLEHTTVGVCAQQLGILESALHRTAEYARQREQFGHAIGAFQAVRHRLADAYIDVEAVRLTLWQAAWRLSEGLPAAEEVATAKYWTAEAGHRVAHTAVHIHGGVGIDTDHDLHRYFVAAKRLEFTLGGATAQLRVLGDLLAVS
ncbi:acyl-CoA dehydrogenase family protein [Amycolatopsis endophytica]|uniref:Alkylation response protein AidB-like acyl-CoA dehydrogenase n=1 Tax=Amycolatopsis endophytica TaxID=860233 RepID=A0A853B5D3_9PSEU|nr:acyl-CoA dehydrogenase family protein [Amycolatopsis endophytica]NYI90443.1 alkylation response protein AidB-like acyl-CoA dehydrogenase [Amycolatopsis endophytica]